MTTTSSCTACRRLSIRSTARLAVPGMRAWGLSTRAVSLASGLATPPCRARRRPGARSGEFIPRCAPQASRRSRPSPVGASLVLPLHAVGASTCRRCTTTGWSPPRSSRRFLASLVVTFLVRAEGEGGHRGGDGRVCEGVWHRSGAATIAEKTRGGRGESPVLKGYSSDARSAIVGGEALSCRPERLHTHSQHSTLSLPRVCSPPHAVFVRSGVCHAPRAATQSHTHAARGC